MAADDLAEARTELEKEFAQVRQHLGEVEQALKQVLDANADDDIESLLEVLEDKVHKARTGGLLGSGAKGHARARQRYLELQAKPAPQ